MVVSRRNFDDVSPDKVQAPQSTEDSNKFAGRETTYFGRTGSWSKCRIQHVYVDRQVDGHIAQLFANTGDLPIDANLLYFPCAEDNKPESGILCEILGSVF